MYLTYKKSPSQDLGTAIILLIYESGSIFHYEEDNYDKCNSTLPNVAMKAL